MSSILPRARSADPTTADPWDAFWHAREVEEIYPAVSDIVGEIVTAAGGVVAGKRILEVGPGTGRESGALLRLGAEVVMLDISREALRLCRQAAPGATPVLGDAMAPPLEPGSFDIVFHQGLLEHFKDPAGLIEANLALLKPGGLLLVDVPQRWHPYTLLKKGLIAANRWFAGWETEFSPTELRTLLEADSCTVQRVYGYFMHPSLLYRILSRDGWNPWCTAPNAPGRKAGSDRQGIPHNRAYPARPMAGTLTRDDRA